MTDKDRRGDVNYKTIWCTGRTELIWVLNPVELKWVWRWSWSFPIYIVGSFLKVWWKQCECRPCNSITVIRVVFVECAILKLIFINEVVLAGVAWDALEQSTLHVVLQWFLYGGLFYSFYFSPLLFIILSEQTCHTFLGHYPSVENHCWERAVKIPVTCQMSMATSQCEDDLNLGEVRWRWRWWIEVLR